MYPLLFSAFMTGVILLLDLRAKAKQPFYKYLAIFFLLAGINYLFSPSTIQAEQFHLFRQTYLAVDPVTNQVIIKAENNKEKKSVRDIKKEHMLACKEKMDYHFEEGLKCFREAENACLLLPEISDREKAGLCFQNFLITIAPAEPKYRAVAALISVIGQYGSAVMSEWQYVDTKLQQAKYHWEMEEHYRLSGKFIQDQLNAEKK